MRAKQSHMGRKCAQEVVVLTEKREERWSFLLSIKSSSNFVGIDKTANETHDDDLFSLLDIPVCFGNSSLKELKPHVFIWGSGKGRYNLHKRNLNKDTKNIYSIG